jgi:hypothetical protein
VYLPSGGVGFRESIDACPGKLSEAGRTELAMRLWAAGAQLLSPGMQWSEKDKKLFRKRFRALTPLIQRHPELGHFIKTPPEFLTTPSKKAKQPHIILLEGIFTAYEETRRRHPDCKAPPVGLSVEFRKFLDAVLVNFKLGPIGDKAGEGELAGPGMIGEGELRGAWRRWSVAHQKKTRS